MKVLLRLSTISCLLIASHAFSSILPCSKWEVLVREHEVRAYERKDGTPVEGSNKKEYCRNKFPTVMEWQEKFSDKTVREWPLKDEKFKAWTQLEKEIVLKALQRQPSVFRDKKGITFLRGIRSNSKGNPASSLKRLNAITLYDEFFSSANKSEILSHEFSHIYIHELELSKLSQLAYLMGWREKGDKFVRLPNSPLVKPDSQSDLSEDLANHFEVYLHRPDKLERLTPETFKLIKDVVGPHFKLER